jgi:Tfp pilus assembly protein PilO
MTDKTPKAKSKPEKVVLHTESSEKEELKTRNYIIVLIVVMVLIVLAGGFLTYYLATRYSHEANKLKAQDEQIVLLEKKQKDLEALKPNYEAIIAPGANGVSDAQLILNALPITSDFKGLIAMLEKMGQQSGVKILNASQSQNTSDNQDSVSNAQTLGFTVSVEGSYQGLIDFLKKTEQSSRVINFSSMALTSSPGQPIQANLTMNTYWQPEADIKPTTRPLQ